jgi:hypothetical protein
MGEIVKFPGKFHRSEGRDVIDTGKKEEEKPELETPKNDTDEIPTAKELEEIMGDIKTKVGIFLDKIEAMKKANSYMAWSGNNAREISNLVKGYTFEELVGWAIEATDRDINTKPFFFHAIALEILKRLSEKQKDKEDA